MYRYSINTPIGMVDPSGMQAYSGYRKPCGSPNHSHASCFWCWYGRGVSQGWPRDYACAYAQQWCHSNVPCKPFPPTPQRLPPTGGNYPPFPYHGQRLIMPSGSLWPVSPCSSKQDSCSPGANCEECVYDLYSDCLNEKSSEFAGDWLCLKCEQACHLHFCGRTPGDAPGYKNCFSLCTKIKIPEPPEPGGEK